VPRGSGDAHIAKGLIALLAACSALGPVATNLFLPALPELQRYFDVPVASAQMSISAYLIAFACGILWAGPLSDRYGRRPIIIGGVLVFAAGSMIAALAAALPMLVAGRIVQAVGASAGITVTRAIVSDLTSGDELARMLAILTMVMVVGTTVSPVIGGELAVRFGWHSGFLLLLILAILLLAACFWLLPETHPLATRGDARSARELARQARAVVAKPVFLGYVIQAGVIYATFLAFISIAPYVMTRVLGRSPTDFGLWYMLLSAGYFLGNLSVSSLARRFPGARLISVGLMAQLAGAVLGLMLVLAGHWDPAFIFGPQLLISYGQGLALPNLTARAVRLAPGFAGVASSLIGFSQQAIAAISVQAMGFAPADSPLPVVAFCAAASLLAVASQFALRRHEP
jgi:DHA1 family bicyclomycin/chloramphenicol resistance-like MFS transporter